MIRQFSGPAVIAVLAVLSTVAEPAQAAPVQTASIQTVIGNTILSTYPDGRTAELWLTADGAYTGKGRKGEPLGGHWTVKGDKLCMRQSRPFPIFFNFCSAMPNVGLNVAWPSRAPTGEAITIRVVPGRFGG